MRMTISIQMIDSGEPCAEMVYTKSSGDVVCKTDGGEYESDSDCVRAAKEDLRGTLKFFTAHRPTVVLYIVRVDGRIVKQRAFDMKVAEETENPEEHSNHEPLDIHSTNETEQMCSASS